MDGYLDPADKEDRSRTGAGPSSQPFSSVYVGVIVQDGVSLSYSGWSQGICFLDVGAVFGGTSGGEPAGSRALQRTEGEVPAQPIGGRLSNGGKCV